MNTEDEASSTHSEEDASGRGSQQTPFFLGVDGGGTKTLAVLIDEESRVVGEGAGGGSNPVRVGLEAAVRNIQAAVDTAARVAGVSSAAVTSACIAAAGISQPIHYNAMRESLEKALAFNFVLVTDAEAALAGALDGAVGVVVIAGTGSIAIGVGEAGDEARSGGWGPTISDEGSAYDIGRRALRAVAAAYDGRGPATALTQLICRRLGIENASYLPGVIYENGPPEPVEIARLAALVTEAAQDGDKTAVGILANAAIELSRLAISVIERLRIQDSQFRVACVGSVFNAGELLLATFDDAVRKMAPGARIASPLFPPEIGAARMAAARFSRRTTVEK